MSILHLDSLDLNLNQLLNVVIQNLAGNPQSPKAGQFYFDTTKKCIRYWTGSAWIDLSDPSALAAAAKTAAISTAKTYTDTAIAELVGSAPEALDTIYELAAAVAENQDLIDDLQTMVEGRVTKTIVKCPALTASGGVCTWTISQPGAWNVVTDQPSCIVQIYNKNHEQVFAGIELGRDSINNAIYVSFNLKSVAAGDFYAVILM